MSSSCRTSVPERPTDASECEQKKRRKRQTWTDEETKELIKGVLWFGKGNWAAIYHNLQFSDDRTATDLKDKWRNLTDTKKKSRTAKELKELAEKINAEQDSYSQMTRNPATQVIELPRELMFCDEIDPPIKCLDWFEE